MCQCGSRKKLVENVECFFLQLEFVLLFAILDALSLCSYIFGAAI